LARRADPGAKTAEPKAARRLGHDELIDWLRLIRTDRIGPATFRDLLGRFGSAAAAIEALPELAERAGRRIKLVTREAAEQEAERLGDFGGRLIALPEAEYPASLRHIHDAPPLLSVIGGDKVLAKPAVAIVGSRNSSAAGAKMAAILARGLGEHGYTVVSGLARGIDAAAHEASLHTGTVAVFAGGLDVIYPPENARLATAILDRGGAHVSELPFGWEPRAHDFPRRNRIISGIALGVTIVEAAERSGSLITARFAGEQGRLVFAVPGSPLDPRAAGANRLIREGATLVTSVADVLEALEPLLGRQPPPAGEPAFAVTESAGPARDPEEADRRRVLEALGPSPIDVDELIRFTGLKPAMVHLVLLELDLGGKLDRHPGQRVSLK
jgi:DNA processing protein